MKSPNRRRRKFVQPRLQLYLIAHFFGVSMLALGFQFLLFVMSTTQVAAQLPNDSILAMQASMTDLYQGLAISFLLLLPLTVLVGVAVTFRIAGPVFRLRRHCLEVASGEALSACRLRRGDRLMDLCDAINQATEPLIERNVSQQEDAQAQKAA